MVEFYSDNSGCAYIYKKYLDENCIGNDKDDYTIIGWTLSLNSNEKSFQFNIFPENIDNKASKISTPYYENVKFIKEYIGQVSAMFVENGDLRIDFNFENTPFNLNTSDQVITGVFVN